MSEDSEAQSNTSVSKTQKTGPRITRRMFLERVAGGLVGGMFFQQVDKLFVPALHSEIGAVAKIGQEMVADKGESLKERVEAAQQAIEKAYGIDVEFQEGTTTINRAILLEKLRKTLSIYPPQLFQNLTFVAKKKAEAGLDMGIITPDQGIPFCFLPEESKKTSWKVTFKNHNFLTGGTGGGSGITVDKLKGHLLFDFSGLFAHELGHTIHGLSGNPALTSFSEELSAPLSFSYSLEGFSAIIKNLPQRLLLPGFVSVYSRFNLNEDAAETFTLLLDDPKKALAVLNNTEYRGELKLKLIAAMDMLYCFSGGLMDKQYFSDLAQGKVNEQYWETKQAEPYIYGRINETTVLFVTDIDKSPQGRLPAIIEMTEVKEGKDLSSFDELSLGSLEGRSIAIKKMTDKNIGPFLDLVVNDTPLNLYAPADGTRVRVRLQTFSEQVSFDLENKGGVLLIGEVERGKTGDISEKMLKTINLPNQISKGLGFAVLGAQAWDLTDRVLDPGLTPSESKKLALKLMSPAELSRRIFLKRVAAAAALTGIVRYLSF